jgi:hypothetical protein
MPFILSEAANWARERIVAFPRWYVTGALADTPP